MRGFHSAFACLVAAIVLTAYLASAEVSENLLQNPSFEGEVAENGIPSGWSLYGDRDDLLRLSIIDEASDGEKAVF
ncbi:MAG: hypothetical protein R6V19_16410, partial [Armatimonadota bacterium]